MAINWDILKAHYLRANRTTQLDCLALNLTWIRILANSGADESIAQHLVRESQDVATLAQQGAIACIMLHSHLKDILEDSSGTSL